MAGLFFCLASAEGAGLLFCLAAIQPHTSIYSGLYTVHTFYTAKTPKPFTGLYRGISVDLTHSSAHNTANTQAAYTPPAPRWTLYRPAQPPYYNKVYKGAPLSWIHARRCSIAQTMPAAASQCIRLASGARVSPARSRCFPRPAAGDLAPVSGAGAAGQSSGRGAAGGAEPLTATAASLFGLSPDS